MINLGRGDVKTLADDWTTVTRDKALSAQFELSIGETSDGFEIFTLSPTGLRHQRESAAQQLIAKPTPNGVSTRTALVLDG